MPYTTEPLSACIGYHLRIAEEYDEDAVLMQKQVDRIYGLTEMHHEQRHWRSLVVTSMQKARQHRRWAKDIGLCTQ